MSSATMEISMEIPQKKNLRINILKEKHPDSPWGLRKLHVPRLPLNYSNECFSGEAAFFLQKAQEATWRNHCFP